MQVIEKLRKQNSRITGPYLNKLCSVRAAPSPLTFPQIARIAGWTYRECFSIGVGHGWWASARFPILVAANERDAADICEGLNHRHRTHPHPDSPRFGWLPASAFPHDEQLDIGAKVVEAQAGMIRGEAAAAIHSLAAEAVAFQESLQRLHLPADQDAQSRGTGGKATVAARMIDLVKDSATHTWTAEQFRAKLGCKSRSTVTNTAAWKQLAVARESARLQTAQRAYDKNLDKRRRPKRKGRPERLGD